MATTGKLASTTTSDKSSTNPRGIPLAPFVDRVEDYVSSRAEVESTLRNFQEMISKYQFMEASTQKRLLGLREKIPDIQSTLDMVQFLQTRKPESEPLETTFELNDTLYAKAHVPYTDEVYLWLGVSFLQASCVGQQLKLLRIANVDGATQANVMLSYPLEEASELLQGKLDSAKQKMSDCQEDIDFLREQITTLEVATARVYNWDVTQRRKERLETGESAQRKGIAA